MTLSDLEHKNIALWGLGKEGMESYRALRARFPTKPLWLINRKRPDNLPDDDHIHFILESGLSAHLKDVDLVIKSPGISLYHPLITLLKQHDVTVTSATNIWFGQKHHGTVIAITGSNGKSTSCALLTHILKGLGLSVEFGGNIGTPLLHLGRDADYYVVELSSYQTADLTYAPNIAVLLNLFPEHIQWHHSHDQYFKDKSRLVKIGAPVNILNYTDPLTRDIIKGVPKGAIWFNDPAAIHIQGKSILSGKNILGPLKDITLPGRHNQENICAVLSICAILGFDLEKSFKLAASFVGLPHRLENLGAIHGITLINDSISTTPEATIAALKSFEGQKITLLAGGEDRTQNYEQMAQYIMEHPDIKVITAYSTGPRIAKALGNTASLPAKDLPDAVRQAQQITPKDGIILLSPAAPSYDAFKNFEARGNLFKDLIKNQP